MSHQCAGASACRRHTKRRAEHLERSRSRRLRSRTRVSPHPATHTLSVHCSGARAIQCVRRCWRKLVAGGFFKALYPSACVRSDGLKRVELCALVVVRRPELRKGSAARRPPCNDGKATRNGVHTGHQASPVSSDAAGSLQLLRQVAAHKHRWASSPRDYLRYPLRARTPARTTPSDADAHLSQNDLIPHVAAPVLGRCCR